MTEYPSRPMGIAVLVLTATFVCVFVPGLTFGQSSHFYYSDGQEQYLQVSTEKIAIRFEPDVTLEQMKSIVDVEPSMSSLQDREFLSKVDMMLFELVEGTKEDDVWKGIESLNEHPEIVFASPVFVVGQDRLIPTDQIIVQFSSGVSQSEIGKLNSRQGTTKAKEITWLDNSFLLTVDNPKQNILDIAKRYYEETAVKFCHPNFIRLIKRLSTTPNDTYFTSQWALNNTGQTGGTVDADIDAPEAWDSTQGREAIVIAIIDEGVDTTHEDLSSKIVSQYDAIDQDNVQQPNSWDGHGTACAGIAAAATNNSKGVAGVAWKCSIMPIRIAYSESGDPGTWITTDAIISDGVVTAVVRGADVLSNSWGSYSSSDIIHNAIKFAKREGREGKGCVIACAVGNDDLNSILYPARYDEVIAVGATNEWDERKSPTSQDGENWWGSNYGAELDLVAPGVHIWTTDISGSGGYNTGNPADGDAAGHYFNRFNGTSSATPHVAGLAALILSVGSDFSSDEVQDTIESSADDEVGIPSEDTPGWDQYMGHGRINAHEAISGVSNVVYVGGTMSENTIWDANHVYVVTSDLTIPSGVTLTIDPGTVVKFAAVTASNDYRRLLTVDGVLYAVGTSNDPIVFTSSFDDGHGGDSNGDGSATSPASNNWGYVRINSPGSMLRYCEFWYGGIRRVQYNYDPYMLWINQVNPAPEVRDCSFQNSYRTALYYHANQSYSTTPVITDNTFNNCPTGIVLSGNNVQTTEASITGNNLNTGNAKGIELSSISPSSVISGNTVEGYAIGISSVSCSPQIQANTLTGNTGYPFEQVGSSFPSYSGNVLSGNAFLAIAVGGGIASSGSWGNIEGWNLPYVITGDVTIASGVTLTIDPGMVVKFAAVTSSDTYRRLLTVDGVLHAAGTSDDLIVFTSSYDDGHGGDSNGDGSATSPASNNWGYVRINSPGSMLRYCEFWYGGIRRVQYNYDPYMLWINQVNPAPEVRDCSFQNSYRTALYYHANQSYSTTPVITDNTFNNCPTGIVLSGNNVQTTVVITNNTITDGQDGIYVAGGAAGTSATIEGNEISDMTGSGIYCVSLVGPASIQGNTITNGTKGIWCSECSPALNIANNWIQDHAIYGIQAVSCEGEITHNTLIQTGTSIDQGNGIYLSNACETIISGNTITKYDVGIKSESGSGNPPCNLNINLNRIINNAGMGVYLRSTDIGAYDGPSAVINDNDIYGNGTFNLYLGDYQDPDVTVINAENNWWGYSDSAEIAGTIYDHDDDLDSPTADFIPYRTGPIEPSDPDISVDPDRVAVNLFPDSATTRNLIIHNNGFAGVLTFSIREGVGGLVMAGHGTEGDALLGADLTWLDEEPTTGIVFPGDSAIIQLTFNSSGLDDSTYVGYLIIDNNDLDATPFVVPITLDVSHVFVISPNGGEEFEGEESQPVVWSLIDSVLVDSVSAWYSTDGGETYPYLITSGIQDSSHIDWRVPNTPSDSCKVKIEVSYAGDITSDDETDGLFTITEAPYICGDVDGSGGNPNVGDLTYIVDYLFFDGPPPPVPEAANVDGQGGINVADLIYLVDYIFFGGPEPICGPIE